MNDFSDLALATIAAARRHAHARGSAVVESQDLFAVLVPQPAPPAPPRPAGESAGAAEWE